MKHRKALSLLSAAAMAVSCFSGMAAFAKETTAEVGRIYNASEICDAYGNTDTMVLNQNEDYYNNTLGAPFGAFEDLADYPSQSSASASDTWTSSLTYDITTEGTYTFSVFVIEYNKRYPTITLDGETVLVDGPTTSGLTILGSYGTDRSLAIIQCPSIELDAGVHTITMANNGSQIQGVIAAVLTDDNAEASTPSPKPTAVPAGTPFTQVYKGDGSDIVNGRVGDSSGEGTYTFADGLDDIVYDMFKDASNENQVNPDYTLKYVNYIGQGTKPAIRNLNIPQGTYKIYYVGYNNDGDFTAEINGQSVSYTSKSEFAKTASKTLNVYTFDVSIEDAVTEGTLEFNRDDYWLPDLYMVGITNEAVSYSVSGMVTGADDGYSLDGKTLTFTSSRGKQFSTEINADGSYEIELPKAEYTVFIDDIYYKITDGTSVTVEDSMADVTLTVEKEEPQTVTVTLINPPAEGTTITLGETPVEFGAGVTEKTVTLAPGKYAVSSSSGDMSELSKTELTVSHEATYKNIYFPEVIPAAESFNVTAGPNGDYKTISDALEGIAKLGTPTADNRATITLEGGQIYREQVQINIPYVTITAPEENPATITWYYGIGNTYYSLGADGKYNKDRAMTKIDKLMINPASWGSTILTNKDGITIENVKIENSFNQYYTDEEFEDGAEPNGVANCGQNDRAELKANGIAADSAKATERAAALYSQGKNCEFYNCTVISSQDTIGTGGTMYFKDCTLVGNTDYICAGGNCVFDSCKLLFGGYSDSAKGGALTAAHTGAGESYIFRDCTIGNYGTDIGRQHGTHSYGRDWGGANASVYFFNTTIEEGTNIFGWGDMGGAVNAGTADLHVYNFDNPNEYTQSGSNQNNINKVLTFDEAKAKYEGALDALGFTPKEMVNAETVKTAGGVQDTDAGDYVYGVMTEITTAQNSALSNIKWVISDGEKVYNVNSKNLTNTNGQSWDDVKISGGISANYVLMFHADQGEYSVLSKAE